MNVSFDWIVRETMRVLKSGDFLSPLRESAMVERWWRGSRPRHWVNKRYVKRDHDEIGWELGEKNCRKKSVGEHKIVTAYQEKWCTITTRKRKIHTTTNQFDIDWKKIAVVRICDFVFIFITSALRQHTLTLYSLVDWKLERNCYRQSEDAEYVFISK